MAFAKAGDDEQFTNRISGHGAYCNGSGRKGLGRGRKISGAPELLRLFRPAIATNQAV
jgi:hypothetical protein